MSIVPVVGSVADCCIATCIQHITFVAGMALDILTPFFGHGTALHHDTPQLMCWYMPSTCCLQHMAVLCCITQAAFKLPHALVLSFAETASYLFSSASMRSECSTSALSHSRAALSLLS